MRTMFDRLFAGRNGIDQLNIALFVLDRLSVCTNQGTGQSASLGLPFGSCFLLCSCVFPELGTQAAGKPEISGYDPWISHRAKLASKNGAEAAI